MSSIASFYLIETSKLNALKQNADIIIKKTLFSKKIVDNYWNFLDKNAIHINDFDGSGYIYGNVLIFLEEQINDDFLKNEYDDIANYISTKREASLCIFTHKQKELFADILNNNTYSIIELQEFNEEFSEQGDEETAKSAIAAIQLLTENLIKINNDQQVLLLNIG